MPEQVNTEHDSAIRTSHDPVVRLYIIPEVLKSEYKINPCSSQRSIDKLRYAGAVEHRSKYQV